MKNTIASSLIALSLMGLGTGIASADVYAEEVGDDDGNGIIMEDESGWDCASMGNRICGGTEVNLSALPTIDMLPVCVMEDGSDVDPASLPCVWTNEGNTWLTYSDHSVLVVDDTVRG